MTKRDRYERVLLVTSRFLFFFLIAAVLITCCMTLFLNVMASELGITLKNENVELAAKMTLVNVVALTLIFTVIDLIRIHLAVTRPTERIVTAAEKIAGGDFSVRIPAARGFSVQDNFSKIADCLNKMAEELSGTETLRTDFIANVSHELKTPLAIIQNYATMLSSDEISDEKRIEYANAITSSTKKLAALVSNILRLNKLENQQISPALERFDLGEHVAEAFLDFEEAWEAKGLMIETDIEDGISVLADREMMGLVWHNLISNAIKFTDAGGTVSLSVSRDGEWASVKISDTGKGISKEVGSHIFEKFYQGDKSRASEGNGLGLALVKRVIDITGSDISVESEIGVGTVFTVRIKAENNA